MAFLFFLWSDDVDGDMSLFTFFRFKSILVLPGDISEKGDTLQTG